MKVILVAAYLFLALMLYSLCKVSGDISRQEEERDRLMAIDKDEYVCNQYCPFWKTSKGRYYCKLDGKECEYFNKQEVKE